MNAHPSTDLVRAGSPSFKARMAGSFYLLCIVTNLIELSRKGGHWLTRHSEIGQARSLYREDPRLR